MDIDNPTLQSSIFAIPTANLTGSGFTAPLTVASNSVGIGGLLYPTATGLAEANATNSTKVPVTGLALATGTGVNKSILLLGYFKNTAWTWTVGGFLYLSTTDGVMTQTAPSATGQQEQYIGYAITADTIFFNPNYVVIENT